MASTMKEPKSLRERKRLKTFDRIAETGLKLFITNGYEATTLEAIAAAAGISRRTFFYYFKSKEDVLLAWHDGGFTQALRPAMLEQSPDRDPLDAVRECLLKLASRFTTKESVIVDQLLRSTEALRVRKEAEFVTIERVLVEAMCELWPLPAQHDRLRMAAMLAMGTLRLALAKWRQEKAEHSLEHYLRQSFVLLESQLSRPGRTS